MSSVKEIGQNGWFILVSRAAAIAVVPFLTWMGNGQIELQKSMIELQTAVLIAIEPRVDVLETDVRMLRQEVNQRTVSRFTKTDAASLKQDLLDDINRIEGQLTSIRDAIK